MGGGAEDMASRECFRLSEQTSAGDTPNQEPAGGFLDLRVALYLSLLMINELWCCQLSPTHHIYHISSVKRNRFCRPSQTTARPSS